jgi:spermidine/putrescine-binding protein
MKTTTCLCLVIAACLTLLPTGCNKGPSKPQPTLNLYIWAQYVPRSVLDEFTARTGIKVNEDNFDSNETLLTKLQSGVTGYDLCVPSDYMVRILIAQKLIQPIDPAKVPNLANIDPRFLNRPFDPGI